MDTTYLSREDMQNLQSSINKWMTHPQEKPEPLSITLATINKIPDKKKKKKIHKKIAGGLIEIHELFINNYPTHPLTKEIFIKTDAISASSDIASRICANLKPFSVPFITLPNDDRLTQHHCVNISLVINIDIGLNIHINTLRLPDMQPSNIVLCIPENDTKH